MKILLDTCIWGGVRKELTDDNHDVIWAGEWDSDPGDAAIIELAYKEGRILITLDKYFGELAIVHNTPHHGIIRVVNFPVQKQGEICLKVWVFMEKSCEPVR